MTYPTTFANLAGSPTTNPASLFDTMFNICGNQGNIGCTASGTNAITLTPNTNFFLPTSYTNNQMVTWTQPATSTGAVTLQIGAIGFKKVIMPSQVQAGNGDLVINQNYTAVFCANLDAAAGAWQVINVLAPSVVQPVKRAAANLIVGPTTTTTIPITADEAILETAGGGQSTRQTSISVTINTASVGANGLSTDIGGGVLAINTNYYVYLIFNPTTSTVAGLLDLVSTTAVMPAGYTFFALVGMVRTGAAGTLLGTIQRGLDVDYISGQAASTSLPQLASGVAGDPTVPTWVGVTLSFVPTQALFTARSVRVVATMGTTTTCVIVAANANFGNNTSTTNPPPLVLSSAAGLANGNPAQAVEIVLTTTTIQWASNGAGNRLWLQGYRLNL